MLPRKPLLAALALTLFGGTAQAADEVVVYSSRIDEPRATTAWPTCC